jgi:hypothetical protein
MKITENTVFATVVSACLIATVTAIGATSAAPGPALEVRPTEAMTVVASRGAEPLAVRVAEPMVVTAKAPPADGGRPGIARDRSLF